MNIQEWKTKGWFAPYFPYHERLKATVGIRQGLLSWDDWEEELFAQVKWNGYRYMGSDSILFVTYFISNNYFKVWF